MKKQIKIHNQKIYYTLKTSKRAKRISLIMHSDGSLIAVKPFRLSENAIKKFLRQKANWVLTKLEYFKQFGDMFQTNYNKYQNQKKHTLVFVKQRINYFNKLEQFKFNKISIKNQKTRWGSCSKKGNLNFNYKILFLPQGFADYIIVHELCHLKELNHSKQFWNLVAKILPDYLESKKELKCKNLNFY